MTPLPSSSPGPRRSSSGSPPRARCSRELGNPHEVMPTIHIGGTNGKGSVSTLRGRGAQGGGLAGRALHVAPPGLVPRAHPGGRRADRRGRDGHVDRALQPLILERKATFFEATTAIAFADFAGPRRRDRGGRGGAGRPARQHQRRRAAGERGHQDRARPHEVSRRHARADRHREGRDREAGDAVRDRRAGPGAGGGAPARGTEGGRAARAERPLPMFACCRPTTNGAARSASRARTSGGTRRWRTAILMALPAPYRPPTRGHRRGLRGGAGARPARPAGQVAVRRRPQSGRDPARWCGAIETLRPPRPLHALVSILGDKEWPEMLVQLDRVIDRGVLTVAPTAASRGWERGLAPPLAPGPGPATGARLLDARARVSGRVGAGCSGTPVPCWSPARFTPSATS